MRLRLLCALAAICLAGCAWLAPERSPVVARGDGFSITLEELDALVKQNLLDERTGGHAARLYELRADVLADWIEERVLTREAEQRGMDVDALLETEALPVGQEEVEAFFEQNASRLPPDTALADVKASIRRHLEGRNREAAIEAILVRSQVEVELVPPRLDVAAKGPALGPEDAPVTIIEFGDFQCPYCRRAVPVMKELRERYPDRLRIVYRHLPLDTIHPRARAAAEASACVGDQGYFWPFHDRLYAGPGGLGDAELRDHAEAVGAELEAYDACLEQGTQQAGIEADVDAARSAGITGTPAFVVNGVLVTGAQPFSVFEELIEEELAAARDAP